jgi:predicted enzyme related to lactoylglutathione lyase
MTDESGEPALPTWPVFVSVTIDTTDPVRLAAFWSALLEVEIEHQSADEINLARQPRRGVGLAFQRVPDPTPGKNRVHVDLLVGDLATAKRRAVSLGGTTLDEHERDGYQWSVVADPDGNRFCLIQPGVDP